MNCPHHRLTDLFAQLGLASDPPSVIAFIRRHGQLPGDVRIHEAAVWNGAQRSLLREAFDQDADWAAASDELNVSMHA